MVISPLPENETERLEALRQYHILDTPPENVFDDLTRLASDVCEAPIALITFIDAHRQWFKSKIGVRPSETPRDSAFCAYAILQRQPLIIHDTASDPRFENNPWATSDPHVRFYAGAPLLTSEGYILGTVCVMDYVPRVLRPKQIEGLQTIAHETMILLELRRTISEMSRTLAGLRTAEEREPFFSLSLDLLFIAGFDGLIRQINPAFEKICGATKEMLQTKPLIEFIHPDDRDRTAAELEKLKGGNSTGSFEVRIPQPDGSDRRILWNATPSREKELIYAVGRDITDLKQIQEEIKGFTAHLEQRVHARTAQLSASNEALEREMAQRRQAEQSLRESEEKYRLLFENNPEPMWVFDLQTLAFLAVNEAAVRSYGYSREAFLSMTIKDIRPPEDIPRLMEDVRKMSPGVTGAGLWRHRKKDGTIIDVEITRDLISFSGREAGIALAHDVTERKRAEEEHARLLIREQEARAAAVKAQWRFTFLAEASEILSASLDYEAALAGVARLVIPYLADGCVVDTVGEDRSIHRVAAVATDPSKEAMGLELMRRYPPERGGAHPLQQVLASGKPLLLSEIPDALLESLARDPEHLKIAKDLGIKSAMIVPLSARGKTLGALSFVTMESGRRLGEEDLSLAEDLARRVAVAVDNARLYRAAQAEIRERKETEEALQESEAKNRALLDAIPDMMFQIHRDGTYLDFKPAKDLAPIVPPERFLGKTLQELLPAEVVRQAMEYIRRALETNTPQIFEYSLPADGEVRDYEARIIASGEDRVLSIVREITERKRAEEALRKSEERFQFVTRATNDAIWDWDLVTNAVWWNEGFKAIFGYKAEEIEPGIESWTSRLHSDDKERILSGLHAAIERGDQFWSDEYRFRRGDGSDATILDRGYVVHDQNGRAVRMIGAMMDITELKRAETALRESQRALATLMSNLPGMAYRCRNDRDWTIEFASEGCLAITGYPPDDLIGNKTVSYGSLIHPDDRDSVWKTVQTALQRNRPFETVYRITTASGEERWVWEHGRGVYSPTGDLLALEGFITDITQRKRAEDELASEKERLAVTLGSIGDGVITTDVEERVVLMNKVAESLTGWTQPEAGGRRLHEIFHMIDEKTGRPLQNPAVNVLQTGGTVGLAHRTVLVSRDGTERIIAHSGAPIRDRGGHLLGVALVFRDVTQQQKMEEDLLRASKLEAVGLLAGGIAHDFNNLLTAILGNLSLVKMSVNLNDPLYRRLGDAETASLRARDLAQQLLTFAKGGGPIKKTVSMEALLKESIQFVLRGSNVGVEFFISHDLWPVEIDEGQISQVLHNLVINAQQAMPQGGVIEVHAENYPAGEREQLALPPGRYVQISIRDFGIGIPKEHLSKIFDPYFTTKQKGSGLGLSTSYSIIKKHDGTMTVDSELGKGSTFSIYLPASSRQVEPGRQAEKPLQGRGKILIMDDEPAVRAVAGEMLSLLGYEIGSAEHGSEAIARYREAAAAGAPFDLVIMDLTVPGKMGGSEAIRRLLEIDPQVKAVVSSGYSNDPIMSDYSRYGFKGVIAKPYQLEQLSKTVHEIITGSSSEQAKP